MRVRINPEICVGHGMCALHCPEVFILSDEDGHGIVRQPEVPEAEQDAVMHALQSCPEGAITIE